MCFYTKLYLPSLKNEWGMAIFNIWPPRSRSKRGQRSKSRSDLVRGHLYLLPYKIPGQTWLICMKKFVRNINFKESIFWYIACFFIKKFPYNMILFFSKKILILEKLFLTKIFLYFSYNMILFFIKKILILEKLFNTKIFLY